jgi:hypothetical protein
VRLGDPLTAPNWCLSFIDQVEKQLRSLPQPDFVFGYPFSASIRKPGQPRPAFLAISYAPQFDEVKGVIVEAGAAVRKWSSSRTESEASAGLRQCHGTLSVRRS